MIGLADGWDDDFYDECNGQPLRVDDEREQQPSRAMELLRRASGICDGVTYDEDICMHSTAITSHVEQLIPPSEPPALETPLGICSRRRCGVTDDVELPQCIAEDVRSWAEKAPTALSSQFSFRASFKKGLIAVPFVSRGGKHKIRLLRLEPHLLRPSSVGSGAARPDFDTGVGILESHLAVSFCQSSSSEAKDLRGSQRVAQQFPVWNSVPSLLQQVLATDTFTQADTHTQETFELLHELIPHDTVKQPDCRVTQPRKHCPVRRLSAWLSRVNTRKVKVHVAGSIHKRCGLAKLCGEDADSRKSAADLDDGLKAVFHHLTANSVRGALEELGKASETLPASSRVYFDRLAAMISACGGASTPCAERRQALKQQLAEWRRKGVNKIMGIGLWRIYSLLAGDLVDVVADSIDWRTAFAMFMWYRCPGQEESLRGVEKVQGALHEFNASVIRRGVGGLFGPAPSYCSSPFTSCARGIANLVPISKNPMPACDLQYNIIRAATGVTDWGDVSRFDYMTRTDCPLDVSHSWHVSLICLATSGGDLSDPAFQKLTIQYVFLLEITGHWEWAAYVSRFLSDSRSRSAVIQGLLLRHVSAREDPSAATDPRLDVPESWWWRAEAIYHESLQDWPAAATGWFRAGKPDRAVTVALCHVFGTLIAGHTTAPFQRGSAEAVMLMPMSGPGQWLLKLLEESLPQLAQRMADAVAEAGRNVLIFMRDWATSPTRVYDTVSLSRLHWMCEELKRHSIGSER